MVLIFGGQRAAFGFGVAAVIEPITLPGHARNFHPFEFFGQVLFRFEIHNLILVPV